MYKSTIDAFEGLSLVVLTSADGNCKAEILPGIGAILHSFCIQRNGEWQNVIANYKSGEELSTKQEALGFKSAKLSPFVCRLRQGKYSWQDKEYAIEKFYLGKHAIHGILYDADFKVISQRADEDAASAVMQYNYKGTDKGFPFPYTIEVAYQLEENNSLKITTIITNDHDHSIPVADGWHPYFTLGAKVDDLQLEFQSREMVMMDEEVIPTGALVEYDLFSGLKFIGAKEFDDCFSLNFDTCQPMLVLRNKEDNLQIEIRPEKPYPYLQIYTPPDRKSIAIENLSAAPDAFNNKMGLQEIAAGELISFVTNYRIKEL